MGVVKLDAYVLIVKGSDRVKFVDGLSTNKIEGSCTTVFTTKNAKIIDMVDVIDMGNFLALVGYNPYKSKLIEHISSRVLGQDISITDVSTNNNVYLSTDECKVGSEVTVTSTFRGLLLIAPKSYEIEVNMTRDQFNDYRVQNLIPHQGHEISEKVNPLICGLGHLVHQSKGCYIGQEILVRMRSRGRINKKLVRKENPVDSATTVGSTHSLKIDRV